MSLLAALVFLSSCNEYQKVLKNTDVKAKNELAQKYYAAKDFKRANRLYEQITPKYIGKPQGERVMFFYANTFFETRSYNYAGYQFERFIKSYPKSDKAQEAAFLGAKSFFMLSPSYSLDQTDTDKALVKLQNFINAYPDSEFMAEANEMAQELTTKKERKAFEIGKQFNKISKFDLSFLTPAMKAMDNFISESPGSNYREEAFFIKLEATTNFALNSFDNKKPERLKKAKEAYNTFAKNYPESKFAKKAEDLLKTIEKEIKSTSVSR